MDTKKEAPHWEKESRNPPETASTLTQTSFSPNSENGIRSFNGKDESAKLTTPEKILASALGGGLSAWNQPIEVVRVEMQSRTDDPNRPKKMTVGNTFAYIYKNNGLKGLYRGVAPRIGLGIWQTICMVALGDVAKEAVQNLTGEKVTAKH
jgi:hypothetical protein